jgi:hypothetical protein
MLLEHPGHHEDDRDHHEETGGERLHPHEVTALGRFVGREGRG